MPGKIADATGSWGTAATWKTIVTVTNAEQTSATLVSTVVTTTVSPVITSGNPLYRFLGDAGANIDGVLMYCAGVTGGATGTVTMLLRNTTTPADVASVTVNVSDLPADGGWFFFSFGSVAFAAVEHAVKLSRSASDGVVSFYCDTLTQNWHRAVRRITTGVPIAADKVWIQSEYTAAATKSDPIVTMNNTASTAHGAVYVSKGGTLRFSTGFTTLLRLSGNMEVFQGGILDIGSTGARVASGSTAVLEFNCTSALATYGLIGWGGTINGGGATMSFDRALINMAANLQVAGTSITSQVNTAWASGDVIAMAASLREATSTNDCEARAMSGVASGTTIPIAAVGQFHSGNAPTQAELVNLTRNVKIRAVTGGNPVTPTVPTFPTFVNFKASCVVSLSYVEIRDIGTTTVGRRGVEIETTSLGSCILDRCSIHTAANHGIWLVGPTVGTGSLSITNCVMFNLAATSGSSLRVDTTTGASITISGNIILQRQAGASTVAVHLLDLGLSFTSNVIVGGFHGLRLQEATQTPGTFSGITIHNCAGHGIWFSEGVSNFTLPTLKVYRCQLSGMEFGNDATSLSQPGFSRHTYVGAEIFGNTDNVFADIKAICDQFAFSTSNFHGSTAIGSNDVDAASSHGLRIQGTGKTEWTFASCNFGTPLTGKSAHTQGDINIAAAATMFRAILSVCTFQNTDQIATPARILNESNLAVGAYIKSQREDNIAGRHISRFGTGKAVLDTGTFNTLAPSERLEPSINTTSAVRHESGRKKIAVASGQTLAPRVFVRKNGSYPSAGANQPRLVLKANPAAGVSVDTVLDTMTVAADSWEELQGSATPAVTDDAVLEFVVDCFSVPGTGAVYVDDWSVP